MSKTMQLLLTENVDNLGIVGDVVTVKSGYARNYLLPRELATAPTEERIQALAEKRAAAQVEVDRLRQSREEMIGRLEGFEVTLERSCNDQGLLYGSVTQKDIAEALAAEGFDVRVRDVRVGQPIKRIESYEITVKPENDLEAMIKLWVVADRKIEVDEREEMEFDNEGELIEKPRRREEPEAAAEAEPSAEEAPAETA